MFGVVKWGIEERREECRGYCMPATLDRLRRCSDPCCAFHHCRPCRLLREDPSPGHLLRTCAAWQGCASRWGHVRDPRMYRVPVETTRRCYGRGGVGVMRTAMASVGTSERHIDLWLEEQIPCGSCLRSYFARAELTQHVEPAR